MTPSELDSTLRVFNRVRPFRPYHIEFTSGDRLMVRHPETVSRWGRLHIHVRPDRTHHIFSATTVARIIVPPLPG